MGSIIELIQQYCPNGVEYVLLKTIAEYSSKRVEAKDVDQQNYVGVDNLLQNKMGKTESSFVPSEGRLVRYQEGDVLIGNIRPYLKKIWLAEYDGGTNGDVLVIHITKSGVLSKYLYYCLSSEDFFYYDVQHSKGTKMPRGDKEAVMLYELPLPPLPVQEEIVRILDKFTELETKLETELEMRQKQYEFYRDELLKFDGRDDVEWKPIGEVGEIIRGKRFVHKDDTDDGVPAIHYGELYTHYGVSAESVKTHIRSELKPKMRYAHKGDVVIVGAGENKTDIGVGVAWLGDEDVAVHDACFILTNHNQCSRYLSYCLRTEDYHRKLFQFVSEGKICSFLKDGLAQVTIPIPKDISEQERIADLLDSFDRLVSDISEGLPAEIKMRHHQYEYYRDKLLTFKRLEDKAV